MRRSPAGAGIGCSLDHERYFGYAMDECIAASPFCSRAVAAATAGLPLTAGLSFSNLFLAQSGGAALPAAP